MGPWLRDHGTLLSARREGGAYLTGDADLDCTVAELSFVSATYANGSSANRTLVLAHSSEYEFSFCDCYTPAPKPCSKLPTQHSQLSETALLGPAVQCFRRAQLLREAFNCKHTLLNPKIQFKLRAPPAPPLVYANAHDPPGPRRSALRHQLPSTGGASRLPPRKFHFRAFASGFTRRAMAITVAHSAALAVSLDLGLPGSAPTRSRKRGFASQTALQGYAIDVADRWVSRRVIFFSPDCNGMPSLSLNRLAAFQNFTPVPMYFQNSRYLFNASV
ncbi:hypothetical protein C8R44DRAFT_750586 [Mycena epipterygia]|nr:hypothetical protein C8R44DRAFT_750586 [Mycena epipterygia]